MSVCACVYVCAFIYIFREDHLMRFEILAKEL